MNKKSYLSYLSYLYDELTFGKGWSVVQADDLSKLDEIQELVLLNARKFSGFEKVKTMNELRTALLTVTESDLNKLKLFLIAIPNLSIQFQKAFLTPAKALAGGHIFLQRKPHIMFNIPSIKNTQVMHHIEAMSGISPYTFVLWSALHEVMDGSGIYVVNQKESIQVMNESAKKGAMMGHDVLDLEYKPLNTEYGQAIFFNPYCIHGSIGFKSSMARISISQRFQSIEKPLFLRNSEFYFPIQLM